MTTDTGTPASLDKYFRISERGSSLEREARGGLATFFTMAYIVVLNPIILGLGVDKFGNHLDPGQIAAVTAFTAALMTVIMGIGGNLPIAIAAGLGLNSVVAFQIAPEMSWPEAMGLVVIEGVAICVFVALGLRQTIMQAIPMALKQAISVGIGLFIAFIGLVDAGFVTRPGDGVTPVQLGATGKLTGWPVVVFIVGLLLVVTLLTRKVRGAILISIVSATVLGVIINAAADVPDAAWGFGVPELPDDVVSTPDLGLLGEVSVFGAFAEAGVITALVFIFTLLLSDFFDTMGTVIGVSNEAGLLDKDGNPPNMDRVLFIDAAAAAVGGAASASSNTSYIESAAGVGEGARTGMASVVTGLLFVLALFFTPVYAVVPTAAATPALVAVGFLLMTQAKDIPWDDYAIAIPAFLTMILMPFTFSITNGIGAGFISYVVIRAAQGRWRDPHPLLWLVALLFAAYFALDPIERALGVS